MASGKGLWFSTSAMRAVVVHKFGGTEVLEIRRNCPPPTPGPKEVLVKVSAAGVNPVDTYIRSGNYPVLPMLPYIPGNDLCGTIVSTGKEVHHFQEGDRVCSYRTKNGAYAELAVCAARHLVRLPDDYDFTKGAAVGTPYITAYRALFQRANAKPGQTILIHGASGGVGMAATQLCLSRGIQVFGTAGTAEGLEMVKKNGAMRTFNHKLDGYTLEIMTATERRGVDIILEMMSNVNLAKDLDLIAHGGTVVVVGCRGATEVNPRQLMTKESNVKGLQLLRASDEELREATVAIEAGLTQGHLDPVVCSKYSLNDVRRAHEEVMGKAGTKGKVILII